MQQAARQSGMNVSQFVRVRLGYPRAVVRAGEPEPTEITDVSGVIRYLAHLGDLEDGDNMLLHLIARELGISRQRIEEAAQARTPKQPEPVEFAGGFARR